jgi:ATP-dependent Clp protease adaptor protein ClpS
MMVKNNIQLEEVLEVKSKTSKINNIVLFNDDVNTFEWVINCLVSYCGHDKIQAEQCAMLVHYTGKCEVKKGSFKTLKPICDTLLEKGLTAEIN